MTATLERRPVAGKVEPKHRKLRSASATLWQASPLTYLGLIIAIVLSIFPILWSFIMATRDNSAVYQIPPPFTPGSHLGTNVSRVLNNSDASFLYGLANSAIVSTVVTVSVVFFSTLAGFAFAKLRFKGRNALLLIIILTMMVPTQLGIIPLYMIMVKLGWTDTLQAVIVPFLVKGFGVFFMRQYIVSAVPDELIEAARIDGSSAWGVYWHVVLPALRPAAAVLGLFTFMQTWNDFLWPLVVTSSPEVMTVQLGLATFQSAHFTNWPVLMAGTMISQLPVLVLFLFGQRYFVRSIATTGLR